MREHLSKIDNEDKAEVHFHFHGTDYCMKDVSFYVLDYIYKHPNTQTPNELNLRGKILKTIGFKD